MLCTRSPPCLEREQYACDPGVPCAPSAVGVFAELGKVQDSFFVEHRRTADGSAEAHEQGQEPRTETQPCGTQQPRDKVLIATVTGYPHARKPLRQGSRSGQRSVLAVSLSATGHPGTGLAPTTNSHLALLTFPRAALTNSYRRWSLKPQK